MPPTTKTCTRCGEEHLIDHYHRDAKGAHGRRTICKGCMSVQQALWYRENRERVLNRLRRQRAAVWAP